MEDERNTVAYKLWHELFHCRLPNIETYSVDYIRMYGMPTCGDKTIDKQMANELVDRMLPVSEIVKYFEQGAKIRLAKVDDSVKIYNYITEHINNWKQFLENGINTGAAPIDELKAFDRLAVAVHEHAKYQFNDEIVESIMSRRMSSVMRVSRKNLLAPAKVNVIIDEEGQRQLNEERLHKHVSMADSLTDLRAPSGRINKWK